MLESHNPLYDHHFNDLMALSKVPTLKGFPTHNDSILGMKVLTIATFEDHLLSIPWQDFVFNGLMFGVWCGFSVVNRKGEVLDVAYAPKPLWASAIKKVTKDGGEGYV